MKKLEMIVKYQKEAFLWSFSNIFIFIFSILKFFIRCSDLSLIFIFLITLLFFKLKCL